MQFQEFDWLSGLGIFNNYPAKSRGISPDTDKIRRYSARLSKIILLILS